jgi:hypothetical protein
MADLSALLCALCAFAVEKVDDFVPMQQMRDLKFITKKPAEDILFNLLSLMTKKEDSTNYFPRSKSFSKVPTANTTQYASPM